MTPLRVAVVGPGGWGRQHTRVFSGRPDTELVAVVGRDPARTAAEADRLGAVPYTDVDAMMRTERPDLVTVSLPNEAHHEPTMRLLEHDVPLLLEKPLVFDLDQADALLARAGDRFVAIDFNHRYAEPVRMAKRAIDAGEIGAPVFATWRFGGEAGPRPDGGSPHRDLIETQCHAFDMLEHLVGPIRSVAAQMTGAPGDEHRTVAVALAFDDGAVGTLLGSYDTSYAYPDTHLLEVNGSAGRVTVHDTVARFTQSRVGDPVESVWRAGYFDDEARSFERTFDRYVDDMLRALRAGGAPPVPAAAGRRALLLATRTIESAETGRRVEVGT